MCVPSTDFEVLDNRRLRAKYAKYGLTSIWDEWDENSGIRPCRVYCRHCVLATTKPGVPQIAADSFLDDTYLVDRTTRLREYLDHHPHVMNSKPPAALIGRYSG